MEVTKSMRLFAVLTVICLLLFFVFHAIFIVFDYAYYNPDSGAFIKLTETMNETLNPVYRNITYNQSVMFRQAFGIGRFAVLGLCLVFFVIGVVDGVQAYERKRS